MSEYIHGIVEVHECVHGVSGDILDAVFTQYLIANGIVGHYASADVHQSAAKNLFFSFKSAAMGYVGTVVAVAVCQHELKGA